MTIFLEIGATDAAVLDLEDDIFGAGDGVGELFHSYVIAAVVKGGFH
jgi:hypothetical protein